MQPCQAAVPLVSRHAASGTQNQILELCKQGIVTDCYAVCRDPGGPHRSKESQWYVDEEEWPQEKYPMWAHGAGYILSKVQPSSYPLASTA